MSAFISQGARTHRELSLWLMVRTYLPQFPHISGGLFQAGWIGGLRPWEAVCGREMKGSPSCSCAPPSTSPSGWRFPVPLSVPPTRPRGPWETATRVSARALRALHSVCRPRAPTSAMASPAGCEPGYCSGQPGPGRKAKSKLQLSEGPASALNQP